MTHRPGLDRRRFLASVAALPLLPRVAPVLHAGNRAKKKTIVAIYLRGGADPLNAIVPHDHDLYYEVRPQIAIPRPGEEKGAAVDLDGKFGLHPALADLHPLWEDGALLPITCVGSPHPTRSHFDAQDFMEYAAPGLRSMKEGWLNRWLAATEDDQSRSNGLRALAMQKLLPRSLRGTYPAVAVPKSKGSEVDDVLDEFEDLYGGGEMGGGEMGERREDDAVQAGRETIRTLRTLYQILEDSEPGPADRRFTRNSTGKAMRNLSRLIRADAGLEAAAIDVPSWDTHIQQGGSTGRMANLLGRVGPNIAALLADVGKKRDDVLVMVMSEFGRTVRENGNRGTDHGHGGFMLLAGGGVNGGRVLGDFKGLDPKVLYQGRDLPVNVDFRDVFHDVLEGFAGFTPTKGFFPDFDRRRKRLRLFA